VPGPRVGVEQAGAHERRHRLAHRAAPEPRGVLQVAHRGADRWQGTGVARIDRARPLRDRPEHRLRRADPRAHRDEPSARLAPGDACDRGQRREHGRVEGEQRPGPADVRLTTSRAVEERERTLRVARGQPGEVGQPCHVAGDRPRQPVGGVGLGRAPPAAQGASAPSTAPAAHSARAHATPTAARTASSPGCGSLPDRV
jgi:hypothetical protein